MKKILQFAILVMSIQLIGQPLNGTVTVGTGGDYLNFTSSTGLFKAINDNGLDGNLTVLVISDLTELATVSLNQWTEFPANSNYTLTINSNNTVNKTILSNSGSDVFRMNGVDNVIIDGSINGTGVYLSFVGWTRTVFFFSNGATNNQLKNIKISSRYTTSGSVIFAASNNSNNLVENCEIFNRPAGTNYPKHGIHSYNITNQNNIFRNNKIYGFSETGIYIESGDNTLIEGNEIYSDVGVFGIHCKDLNTITMNSNKIYDLFGTSNPQSIMGIRFNHGTGTNVVANITNNMIALNTPFPSRINGISLDGTNSTPITVNVYHNTILISGTEDSSFTTNGISQIEISDVNIKNNIIINTRANTRVNLPGNGLCLSLQDNAGNSNVISDSNILFTSGMNTQIGQWNATRVTTLTDWQNTSGLDMNSISKNVFFVSSTDLHLTGASNGDTDLAVSALPTVMTDFDTDSRNSNTYAGCDEIPNTLSVQEIELAQIQLYPNPTTGLISFVGLPQNTPFTIYDLSGKTIQSGQLQVTNKTIDVSNLQSGYYFIKLKNHKTIPFIKN